LLVILPLQSKTPVLYNATWHNAISDMMTEPSHALKYANTFPDEQGWDLGSVEIQDSQAS